MTMPSSKHPTTLGCQRSMALISSVPQSKLAINTCLPNWQIRHVALPRPATWNDTCHPRLNPNLYKKYKSPWHMECHPNDAWTHPQLEAWTNVAIHIITGHKGLFNQVLTLILIVVRIYSLQISKYYDSIPWQWHPYMLSLSDLHTTLSSITLMTPSTDERLIFLGLHI